MLSWASRSMYERPALERVEGLVTRTIDYLAKNRLLTVDDSPTGSVVDIAHEILVSAWPTLLSWMAQKRTAEQTRRRLEARVADWQRHARRGGLLDSVELREATSYARGADVEVLGHSAELLDLLSASGRRLWILRVLVVAAVLALSAITVVAIGASVRADRRRVEANDLRSLAELRAHVSLSRQLAAQASDSLDAQVDRALLLGIEALHASDTFEARTALLRAFECYPMLRAVIPLGSDTPLSVAWSHGDGGGSLAAARFDGHLMRWDGATFQPLASFPDAHHDLASDVKFSPDDRWIATGGDTRSSWRQTVRTSSRAVTRPSTSGTSRAGKRSCSRSILIRSCRKLRSALTVPTLPSLVRTRS
jgi:hypothetical protein